MLFRREIIVLTGMLIEIITAYIYAVTSHCVILFVTGAQNIC